VVNKFSAETKQLFMPRLHNVTSECPKIVVVSASVDKNMKKAMLSAVCAFVVHDSSLTHFNMDELERF
jgi:hypothetical protein